MVDVSAISAAIASFSAAKNIAQSMVHLRDAAAFQTKLIEFQSAILEAQSNAFAANEERASLMEKKVAQLEREIASVRSWENEKQRYQLRDFGCQTYAYLLRPEAANEEPSHRLCATCFHNSRKSILQFIEKHRGQDIYYCESCTKKQSFGCYVAPPLATRRQGNWMGN
jgi:hypothetical protein